MERYEEEAEDSDNETDPEQLLNEWLGELDSLTVVSLYFSNGWFLHVWLRPFYERQHDARPPLVVTGIAHTTKRRSMKQSQIYRTSVSNRIPVAETEKKPVSFDESFVQEIIEPGIHNG